MSTLPTLWMGMTPFTFFTAVGATDDQNYIYDAEKETAWNAKGNSHNENPAKHGTACIIVYNTEMST